MTLSVLHVFSVFGLPGFLTIFLRSRRHFSSEKTRVRLLFPLFCDSIGTKNILTSDFSKKTRKNQKLFRFQKCCFCFVPVYVRVLANSPGARRTVIESLSPPFATGSTCVTLVGFGWWWLVVCENRDAERII